MAYLTENLRNTFSEARRLGTEWIDQLRDLDHLFSALLDTMQIVGISYKTRNADARAGTWAVSA